jgi:hypothetical protein
MPVEPVPGDGVITLPREGEESMAADLADDLTGISLKEMNDIFDADAHDVSAAEGSAHSILEHTMTRKYNEEDPIEAASVEMILNLDLTK